MTDEIIKDAIDTSRRILGEITDFDADGKLMLFLLSHNRTVATVNEDLFSLFFEYANYSLSLSVLLAHAPSLSLCSALLSGLQCAEKIKYEFDERWGPHWHVVVGRSFGSFITHETKKFLFFYLEDKAIMIFKAG